VRKEILIALGTGLAISIAGITFASADTDEASTTPPQAIKSSSDTQTNLANAPTQDSARKTEP
jgi:hypothetical protein